MNKQLNFLTFLFLIIISSIFVSSAPPSTPFEDTQGSLYVISAHSPTLKYGDNVILYFNVYSINGTQLNNTQFNCTIHLYNWSDGKHLYEGGLATHSYAELEYEINYSLFTHKQNYEYLITCWTLPLKSEWGYSRNSFKLSTTGEIINYEGFAIAVVLILLPLIFAFLLLYWVLHLGEEHTSLKIGLVLFTLTSFFFSLWTATETVIKFFEWDSMQDLLTTALWIYGLLFFVIFSYWSIYLITKAFESARKKRAEKLNY